MQIDVEDKQLSVVLNEAKFDVALTTDAPLDVNVGESAKIDVGQAIDYIKSGQAEVQEVVDSGTAAFNANAIAKTNEFNQNAIDKTSAFDSNATAKTNAFNQNATDKTTAFNNNATAKTGDFNTNATDKTTAFDNNYTAKLGAFNDNAATKQAQVDASAALAKQYAIGDPSEPTGNSAKYWAEQAASSVTGLGARVTAIEGKIPADASSSNQLADKSWVGDQGYITGITSGDVTTALGYTPYNSSNPNGYTSNVGTVTSVNNTSPDGNGNVTLSIPTVNNPTITLTQGGVTKGSFTLNQASGDTIALDSGGSLIDIDNKSITENSSDELQTVGVINSRDSSTAIKTWTGTKAQYDAIVTKDSNTLYEVEGYGVFLGTTQIAAGSSQLNNPFSLLDYKYSEYELDNASWLLSNGQWNNGAVYTAVYNLLLAIYNGTETKAGVSVKLSTETYADTDFVLNTGDTTFRLPLKVALASGKAVVGNGNAMALTTSPSTNPTSDDATHYFFESVNNSSLTGSGLQPTNGNPVANGTSRTDYGGFANNQVIGLSPNPTLSGIETSANGLYLYFYVGETVSDATVITAGEALTDIANLKNLSNISDNGTSTGASWAMPSDTYDDLTLGASGSTYTAPANGWFTISKTTTGAQYIALINTNNNIKTEDRGTASGQTLRLFLPVKKNDVVDFRYTVAGTTETFRFVYAVGSESEAQNV